MGKYHPILGAFEQDGIIGNDATRLNISQMRCPKCNRIKSTSIHEECLCEWAEIVSDKMIEEVKRQIKMTEHKMTDKKVLDANTANGSRMDEARVLNAMKEFALQVATEAVEEEQENVPKKEVWVTCDVSDLIHRVSNNVIKNIKNRLNDE